jgi:hypothetical protein
MNHTRGFYLAFFFLTGCAISRKVDYGTIYSNVPAFNQRIAIASWDQREQILSGARKPDFVGYTRSGAGIAYPMGTESGRPFTDDLSTSISSSLTKYGSKTIVVLTQTSQKESQILAKLINTKSDRLVLIDCKQYFTDGYGATSLNYNLQISIYSSAGDLIKQKSFNGKRALGGSAAWGPGNYKQYMPEALKKLIGEIFNDPEITAAFQN